MAADRFFVEALAVILQFDVIVQNRGHQRNHLHIKGRVKKGGTGAVIAGEQQNLLVPLEILGRRN